MESTESRLVKAVIVAAKDLIIYAEDNELKAFADLTDKETGNVARITVQINAEIFEAGQS